MISSFLKAASVEWLEQGQSTILSVLQFFVWSGECLIFSFQNVFNKFHLHAFCGFEVYF